jgi:hypothetical protein
MKHSLILHNNSRNKTIYSVFAIFFSLILVEALSYVVIWTLPYITRWEIRSTSDIFLEQSEKIMKKFNPSQRKQTRGRFDKVLGWYYGSYDNEMSDFINTQNLRSTHEYSLEPPPGKIRVAAFGDSFVYSCEVSNSDSWSHLIEKQFPNIEVLNFGVGAYGSDQAYLRYKHEGKKFNPHIVIIGFTPIMINRNINVYRRFFSSHESVITKPRFILNNKKELTLIPNPISSVEDYKQFLINPQSVRKFGKYDYHYNSLIYENPLYNYFASMRVFTFFITKFYTHFLDPNRVFQGSYFNTSSEAFRLLTAILEKHVSDVKSDGAIPLIVILPMKKSLLMAIKGKDVIYAPLVEYLARRQIKYIDLSNDFLAHGLDNNNLDNFIMSGGHYTRAGNEIVSTKISSFIIENYQNL